MARSKQQPTKSIVIANDDINFLSEIADSFRTRGFNLQGNVGETNPNVMTHPCGVRVILASDGRTAKAVLDREPNLIGFFIDADLTQDDFRAQMEGQVFYQGEGVLLAEYAAKLLSAPQVYCIADAAETMKQNVRHRLRFTNKGQAVHACEIYSTADDKRLPYPVVSEALYLFKIHGFDIRQGNVFYLTSSLKKRDGYCCSSDGIQVVSLPNNENHREMDLYRAGLEASRKSYCVAPSLSEYEMSVAKNNLARPDVVICDMGWIRALVRDARAEAHLSFLRATPLIVVGEGVIYEQDAAQLRIVGRVSSQPYEPVDVTKMVRAFYVAQDKGDVTRASFRRAYAMVARKEALEVETPRVQHQSITKAYRM